MSYLSIGDMAQAHQMRRHNVQLKQHTVRLTEELTTGNVADLAKAVSGDFKALAGIDRSLQTLRSYKTAASEAALFAATMQTALAAAQDIPALIGATLLSAATTGTAAQVDAAAADARQKFLGVVSTLNAQVGGRFVFSGLTADQRPFATGEAMLAALTTATAAETTAAGVIAQLDAWFDAAPGGGGFLDTSYFGSTTALAPLRIGPAETATLDVTGADPAIRALFKGLALAALVAEGALAGNALQRSAIAQEAGLRIIGAETPIVGLRARVGTIEAHVDQVATRNAAEKSALEIARAGITAADPYDTASALEAVIAQIETLYTLTARLARLNFSEYI